MRQIEAQCNKSKPSGSIAINGSILAQNIRKLKENGECKGKTA